MYFFTVVLRKGLCPHIDNDPKRVFNRIQTEDPVIAFVTRSVVTVPLNKPEMFNGLEIGFVNGINNKV